VHAHVDVWPAGAERARALALVRDSTTPTLY